MREIFRNKWILVPLLIVVTFLITLYLWQSWRVIDLRKKRKKLEKELAPLVEENRRLKVEVNRVFSYERIERIAKNRLEMKRPKPGSKRGED